jgi:Flp pilus assembly pilin Flp
MSAEPSRHWKFCLKTSKSALQEMLYSTTSLRQHDLTVAGPGRTISSLTLEACSHSSDVVDAASQVLSGGRKMNKVLQTLWSNQQGQDIAEYAVMLAVILVIVVGTIRLVGSNANKVFSSVASSVQ